MKIVIERSPSDGVYYHRQYIQHKGMDVTYIGYNDPIPVDADLFVTTDRAPLRNGIKCKVVVDIDDYPVPPPHHVLAVNARFANQKNNTIEWAKRADLITTTTHILSGELFRLTNGRIAHILPNAIDKTEPQFSLKAPERTNVINIGFVGGWTHKHDLAIIRHAVKQLYADPDYNTRFVFVYAGFDYEVKIIGKPQKNFVSPHVEVERMFSNGEPISEMPNKDAVSESKRYFRRYSQNIGKYAKVYTVLHAAIAPLEKHRFNECKSELKFVEAAAFGLPLICSDVGAYSHLTNVIKCNNSADWLRAFKDVIDGVNLPNPIEEANQCFNIEQVRKDRALLYKSLLNG